MYCKEVTKIPFYNIFYDTSHCITEPTYAPSKDSDQTGQMPSLITVFTRRLKKPIGLSFPSRIQRMLCYESVDTQTDPSLHLAHSTFCCRSVMRLLLHFGIVQILIRTVCPTLLFVVTKDKTIKKCQVVIFQSHTCTCVLHE